MFEILLDPANYPFWLLIIACIAGAIAIMARPFSTYVKFVYPNAKFEAMGNPFIGSKELESIAESKDIISFKETINTLKDYNISGDDVYSIHKGLDENFLATVAMMRTDSSKKLTAFFDAYLAKQDIALIKTVLKNRVMGKKSSIDADKALLSRTKDLLAQLHDADADDLAAIITSFGLPDEIGELIVQQPLDVIALDVAIDKHIITTLDQVKVPYKCTVPKEKLVKTMIDIQNIKNLIRAKQRNYDEAACKTLFIGEGSELAAWKFTELAEVDSVSQIIAGLEGTSYYSALKDAIEIYTKEASVQLLEIALDIHFLRLITALSTQHFVTIGPTIRFLVSKEFEIKNLKIIAKGISEQVTADRITRLLVTEDAS